MKYLQLRPPKAAGSLGQDIQTKAKAPSAVENGTNQKPQLGQVDKGISNAPLKSVLNEHNSTLDTTFSQKTSNVCFFLFGFAAPVSNWLYLNFYLDYT